MTQRSSEHDWDDERLTAAFVSAFDKPAPAGLVERTMAATREPAPAAAPRWAALAGRWRLAGLAVSLVVTVSAVIAVAAIPHGSGGPQPAFRTYDSGTFHFTYPGSWDIHTNLPATTGFGSTVAILGTLPIDPACGDLDINCYYQEKLQPGTLSVVVGTATTAATTLLDTPLQASDTRTTVDGLPAIFSDRGHVVGDYYESDLSIGWRIATPRSLSDMVTVDASIRGPGTETMRGQVEALIASFGFDGPPRPTIPTGSAAAGLAERIAVRALESRDRDLRTDYEVPGDEYTVYGCIQSDAWSTSPGQPPTTVDATGSYGASYGPGGWLGGPQEIQCTATIQVVGGAYWKLVFEITAGAGSSQESSSYLETDWLTADGALFQSVGGGSFAASLIDTGPDSARSAARAATIALEQLRGTSDFYACFLPTDGESQAGTITSDPIGDNHYEPTPVTCTTGIEPRADRVAWHVTLDARWTATAGREAGHMVGSFDMDASGIPGPVAVSGDSLSAVPQPPGVTPPPQPAPSSDLSPSVDALGATTLAGHYEMARSGGNWPEAWKLLSPRTQAAIGSLARFTSEEAAYNQAGGTEYVVQEPTQDPDLIATFLGASRTAIEKEADMSRGYLIFISHPNVKGASEGSTGLFVAPLRSGQWRIWIVH